MSQKLPYYSRRRLAGVRLLDRLEFEYLRFRKHQKTCATGAPKCDRCVRWVKSFKRMTGQDRVDVIGFLRDRGREVYF